MAPQNLLQLLQSKTIVDCDTMDAEVPKSLGPFVDCTSNQAIAFFELQKPEHETLIKESITLSKTLVAKFSDVSSVQMAVEIAMVKLQLEISKLVTGFVHVQTNPYHSYSTSQIVTNARRIVAIFTHLDPEFDTERICIKIPCTWEGLQACRILESSGTTTLATILFTFEQYALAGEVGCHYIAPYVNELKVHFEPGFVDNNKAQTLCFEAQRYYEKHGLDTQVLPASLTSTDEIMVLAGVNHITIAPALLQQLVSMPADTKIPESLFASAVTYEAPPRSTFANDEAAWRFAFARRGTGEGERKLSQAINIFSDMQAKLEAMMDQA